MLLCNEQKSMYLARVSPEYVHEVCNCNIGYINVSKYKDCGYGFIIPEQYEVGLLSSYRTITRFIVDTTLKGTLAQLREYVWCGDPTPTELINPKDYKDYGITALESDCLSSDQEEIGAVRTNRAVIHYILVPRNIMVAEENQTPLADTGNRTDLGSGGLRDINPENGRCDLLPASALCSYLEDSTLVAQSHNVEKPVLVNAFYYIMKFIDNRDIHFLTESIACLECWHSHKINADIDNVSRDKTFAQSMLDLSIHYKNGALKYAERNWEKGIPLHSFLDSAIRHLCKEILEWNDEPHDIAVMWNLYGAIWTLQHHPHLDDMPYYHSGKEKSNEINKKEKESGNTENSAN